MSKVPTAPTLTSTHDGSALDADAASVFDPDVFVHGAPYAALARLRAQSPVHPVQLPDLPRLWLLTRHSDVLRASRDDATFSCASGNTLLKVESGPTSAMLPGLDPPRHTLFRKLINQGFTARNVLRLEAGVRRVARQIVADIREKGEFDAVPDISAELSLQVIAEVLGVPQSDRQDIFRWSNAIGSLGIEDPDYLPSPEVLGTSIVEMFTYFAAVVEQRRKEEPRDDILSALLAAEVDGQRLNGDQLNEFFLLLAIAGNETTRNTLSHGILAFTEHPEQRAMITAEPAIIPNAVEELLRWSTPVLHFRRTVMQDVEIGGQQIPAGDWVALHYLSANRDESVFESADRFDIVRKDGQHAAFGGGGTHFCLGAQLARLELRVMLEELYSALPALAVTADPVRLRSSFFHGIKSLMCTTGTPA